MDDSDDDCCYYGSPLEELDPDDVRATKAPRIEDQVVLDKQGRRRFHGAFTGGFSAGYFNSVGTKEGWTPSTFVSSRGQRTEAKKAKPEDFMDEEDLAAHGIAPQGIQATSSFDDSDYRKRKRVIDPSGPIPGVPVLEEILKPTKETMGMKLLRKLGWKPGQGIGPRVKFSQKKAAQKETKKIYGCERPTDIRDINSGSDEDIDEEACDPAVTFAPDDIETLYLSNPKSDLFGLGYKPLDRTPVLGGHVNLFDPSPLVMKEKKKKVLIKGQAFGVGAFEDEDEDIYATEDMSNYDFGDDKSPSKTTTQKSKSHMDLMGLVEKLDGFCLSSNNYVPKSYRLPTLPKDFIPHHKPRRRRFQLKESEMQGLGRHDLTSDQRARIISDRSQATVEVRLGVKGQAPESLKASAITSAERSVDASEVDKLYEEFQNLQGSSRSDFKPFKRDEAKQKRYELYLRMKERGQKDRYYLAQPRSMTEWEREREVQEFDRAAKLFRPLSSTMASRFVTAGSDDSGPKLKDGLNVEVPKDAEPAAAAGEVDSLGQDISDDRMKAAKLNMFGKLTQTVMDWHPDRLLCKRFNVPDPFPDSNFVGVRKTKREKFSIFSILEAPSEIIKKPLEDSRKQIPSSLSEKDDSQDSTEQEEPENYGLKVPLDGPPTMDLFKAIFQDSDSEDEKDSKENKENEEVKTDKGTHSVLHGNSSLAEAVSSDDKELPELKANFSRSEANIKNSVDNFLSSMRRGNVDDDDPEEEPMCRANKQRIRISRFEPQKDSLTGDSESLPKPVFMSRKKLGSSSETAPAKGIFANIDFDLLNSYRTADLEDKEKGQNDEPGESGIKGTSHAKVDSDTSVDSDDEYGPAVPAHLKNRQQLIRSPSSFSTHRLLNQESKDHDSKWVVKDEKRKDKKKHKHEDKSKRRKEKKKKKHKERKHKRKSSKKHRKNSGSDSSSDSSD